MAYTSSTKFLFIYKYKDKFTSLVINEDKPVIVKLGEYQVKTSEKEVML